MGDRTWVHLTIRVEDIPAANKILKFDSDDEWEFFEPDIPGKVYTEFDEVNYGDLPEEKALQAAGIPYDKYWGHGNDYGSGTQYCRYTPEGECVLLDVYDSDINPEIAALLQRIDTPDQLRQFILDHYAKSTPLPWDDQETNSKRFRARQLIAPKEPA